MIIKFNLNLAFIFSILAIILGIFCFYLKYKWFQKENADLFVCILSSRNNFELRKAIRNSWLRDISLLETKNQHKVTVAKFVIGSYPCLLHPENRINHYSCERWDVSIPETSDIAAFTLNFYPITETKKFIIVYNFYVEAMHGITVIKIGIAELIFQLGLQDNANETFYYSVHIYDAITDDEIASAHFDATHRGLEINGYNYKPVQEIFLPKGYEVIMQLKINMKSGFLDNLKTLNAHIAINNTSHNITIVKPTDKYGHHLNINNNESLIPAISFIFLVHNIPALVNYYQLVAERDVQWKQKLSLETDLLYKEQNLHHDMIFVNIVDVYRNLPEKLLTCHQWVHNNYHVKFILKTDDDCYINLKSILESLSDIKEEDMVWWGNFRTYWDVEKHGKWQELEYSSLVYPRFACGSGNVITSSVSSWLNENKGKLKYFQGEDVSLGIWLSGLNVQYDQDDRWQCQLTCQKGMLSLPELTSEKIQWYWNNSRKCASPCQPC